MKKQTCNFLDDDISEHVFDQFKEFNKHGKFASKNSLDTSTTCVDSLASVEIDPSLKNDDMQSSFAFDTVDYSHYTSEKGSDSMSFRSPPPSYQQAMTSNNHGVQLGGNSLGSNSAVTKFQYQFIKNLSHGIKKELSLKLDHEQLNENNWKDVADYFKISHQEIKSFEQSSSHYKFMLVLDSLSCRYPRITVKDLIGALEHLGRQDVVSCVQKLFERVGASPNSYDALMLYHEADTDFTFNEFLPQVEEKAGLKICVPGRDLAIGSLSYKTQLDAMRNSCRKIVVILSNEFLQDDSSDCNWQLHTAMSVEPAARLGNIIPVIYKPIISTHILSGLTACDRTRVLEDSWFWDGIIKGIKLPNHSKRKKRATMLR